MPYNSDLSGVTGNFAVAGSLTVNGVDIATAIAKGLTIVQTSSTTLAPTTGNYYLVTGTTTVNLPAGSNGDVIGIADGASNFGTANCTINPNGAQTIAGETTVTLTADNAFIVLAFWGTRWTIIHGNSFIQPDPSPLITTLTTGSGSFVQNASSRLLRVRVWGATGGSGGVPAATAGNIAVSGNGGNGGYSEKWITITAGETFTYIIGAAGSPGASGNNSGTSGGTTSFTGTASGTVQVTGGGGGGGGGTPSTAGAISQGSSGVASGGDLNLTANRALTASWFSSAFGVYPNNGIPLFGGGDHYGGSRAGSVGALGVGGSPAVSVGDGIAKAGGAGFRGQIIVEEWE